MHCCWHGFFRTNFINTIVPKKCAPKAQDLPKFPNPGSWDMHSLERDKKSRAVGTDLQDKFHQHDCPEKRVPKTFQTVSKRWAKGHAGHAWGKVLCWRGFHFARRSVRRCLVFAPLQRSKLNDNPSIGDASA